MKTLLLFLLLLICGCQKEYRIVHCVINYNDEIIYINRYTDQTPNQVEKDLYWNYGPNCKCSYQ
jgi:hypothetical protein